MMSEKNYGEEKEREEKTVCIALARIVCLCLIQFI